MKKLTKKIFLYLGIILVIFACGDDPKPPADVIDEQTMSKILAEIHLIEAKAGRLQIQDYDSTKVAFAELERRVMLKYKVDTARYKASYKYYILNPDNMVKIYDQTLTILEEMKTAKKKKSTEASKPTK